MIRESMVNSAAVFSGHRSSSTSAMLALYWKLQALCLALALLGGELAAQECGLRNEDGFIFPDTSVTDSDGSSRYGEFPWMVVVLKLEKALDRNINLYQCGGSLIHPAVVLTAAHCVRARNPWELKVRVGEWDTQSRDEIYDHQDRSIVEVVMHADFNETNLWNDVALLFLDSPVELMDTVSTICLPPVDHTFDLSRCFASGWGKDKLGPQGAYQLILKKVELPVVPRDRCQAELRTTRLGPLFELHTSFICAGGEQGRDTCKGDGGSPLICPIPGSEGYYYQAGIVAWGIGCGEGGVPGVYANVAMFRGWIDDQLRQRNMNHSYYLHPSIGAKKSS
uniref:Phenoloxidase-activating factor 2 n=1 Tax=Anopheles dirus TaxID=7168 RepID=A0A1Y9H283_9DIPT